MINKNKIVEAFRILMEEYYNNDSNNIRLEFEHENYEIKCCFAFEIYENINKEEN